jgi:hypothetical protein
VDGTAIAGRIDSVKCHCYELAQVCGALPSPWIASDARTTCALASGEPID